VRNQVNDGGIYRDVANGGKGDGEAFEWMHFMFKED